MNARAVGYLLWLVTGPMVLTNSVAGDPAQPQQQQDFDFGTRYPKGEHEVVPPEQRERLGLDEPSWTKEYGKLHPAVYKALERAEEVAELGKKDPWFDPVGFGGTVYVQVHLKHEQKGRAGSAKNKAAIKQLQSKVLSQLTAADFYVEYAFRTQPGILGYVNRAGLEKLKANADVVAVCLDDKPFPRRPPPVFKVDLPPLKPGDPATQPAQGRFWLSGGKVEREVYQALGIHERVFVMVSLNFTPPDGAPGSEERLAYAKQIKNRVLSTLTADEFWVQSASPGSGNFDGLVNKDALKKLENHPEVNAVIMEPARIPVPKIKFRRP